MYDNYTRFYKMIDRFPRVSRLWDKQKHDLRVEAFEDELCVMSSSEVFIAKFFAAVWFWSSDKYEFDIVDSWSNIDSETRQIVQDWLAAPFYP